MAQKKKRTKEHKNLFVDMNVEQRCPAVTEVLLSLFEIKRIQQKRCELNRSGSDGAWRGVAGGIKEVQKILLVTQDEERDQ